MSSFNFLEQFLADGFISNVGADFGGTMIVVIDFLFNELALTSSIFLVGALIQGLINF